MKYHPLIRFLPPLEHKYFIQIELSFRFFIRYYHKFKITNLFTYHITYLVICEGTPPGIVKLNIATRLRHLHDLYEEILITENLMYHTIRVLKSGINVNQILVIRTLNRSLLVDIVKFTIKTEESIPLRITIYIFHKFTINLQWILTLLSIERICPYFHI